MKKFLKVVFILVVVIVVITGCSSRESVEHLSQRDLIKYVKKNITEKVEFVENNTQDADSYIYTFKLVDRNIKFEVMDSIYNGGLNIDSTQFYDDYKHIIVLTDYVASIFNNLEQERLNILKKYDFEETYYEGIGHTIGIKDYTDLSNLSKYIVELDNLYQFNIKNVENIDLGNIDLYDVISFSKSESSIDGVSFSTNKRRRLKYAKVFRQLEKQYVEHLKKFNLTDETIPKNIWNKY